MMIMNSVSFLSCLDYLIGYFHCRLFWGRLILCVCICFIALPVAGQVGDNTSETTLSLEEEDQGKKKKKDKSSRKNKQKKKKASKSEVKSSKLDDAFWVAKSKQFAKDPMNLKREIDGYREEIENMKAQNKTLEGDERSNYIDLDSLRQAVNRMREDLVRVQEENEELRNVLKTLNVVERAGVKQGLIYRIVLFEAAVEEGDSAFGEFRSPDEAQKFLAYLRKMGFKAQVNVLPYVDGKRVSDESAKSYMGG